MRTFLMNLRCCLQTTITFLFPQPSGVNELSPIRQEHTNLHRAVLILGRHLCNTELR